MIRPLQLDFRSVRIFASAAFLLSFFNTSGFASFPMVYRTSPMGVTRGVEATLTLHGDRIGDAREVLDDQGVFEILDVKSIDGKKAEVRLKAKPETLPGLYPIRLVTNSGSSNVRLVGVGTMPVVAEVEANNTFETPQSIEMGQTIDGVITREDVDYFALDLKEDDRIVVEIEAIRLTYDVQNRRIFDPYVALLDENRFEIASSDDSDLLRQDGVFGLRVPKDGQYVIVVRHSSFLGDTHSGYRLHVGNYPRPVAVIPGGGRIGESYDATVIDVDGTVSVSTIVLPEVPSDSHDLHLGDDRGLPPSPNRIRVVDMPVHFETGDNTSLTAVRAEGMPVLDVPVALAGVVDQPDTFDHFAIRCKKNQKYRVRAKARFPMRSPIDAVVNVFDEKNKSIAGSDDIGRAKDSSLEFKAPADGVYVVRIYDHLRGGSPLHHYWIEVTPAKPSVSLTFKEIRRSESSHVSIPRGGRTAVMALAARADYGGPIPTETGGLPAGVTAQTYEIPAGRVEIPVVFEAAGDAEPTAGFVNLNSPSDQFESDFSQNHKLVLGQNRRELFEFKTEQAAIAITDKAPFEIELVQPKTPIVRNGSKDLIVRIKRDEGFNERVRLRTIYNPPGIGVNNSRYIDKGKNETTIPITANGGAAMSTWPMVFLANYPYPHGNADIATAPIMLQVEDRFFDFEFPRSAATLGTEAMVSVSINVKRDLPGPTTIELVGLPKGVTSPESRQTVTSDTESVTFPITVAPDAKVGKHKTLVCVARIEKDGETIVQTNGTGELRVDKPLPPKKTAKPEANKPKPKPKPPTSKPLSRLEQLRQMRNQ
ncbi:MAG: serine protease [Planctomycetota bacterium]